MGDMNIVVKNMLGKGGSSQNKLSAKGSISRKKGIVSNSKKLKRIPTMASKAISSISSGSASMSLGKAAGAAGAIVTSLIVLADKVISFGINLNEAKTGEQVWANNSRTTLKTVTTLGTNYLYGHLQNELFTKKIISRQNYGLDYGRELFQINVEGTKNKRI